MPSSFDPRLLENMNRFSAPRIVTDPAHRFPWFVRLFLANQRRRYGRALEPARLWGRTPWVFAALSLLYGALDRKRSPIEPALRSLITVRVSQINWCAFCIDINSANCLKRGVSEAQLAALPQFEDSDAFDERTKAALAWAEAMTRSDAEVGDALVERVKRHFDDDALIELTALVAFQNMSSKFNAALGVQPQGFCRVPSAAAPTAPRADGS
jgi:AhpD family alkylhydroperoxidase